MRQEKSCGAAIYIARERETLWLVERMQKGHTSLCKGHVEADETEHETAVREIREETALTVEFLEGFRERIEYSPEPGVTKEVIFFLARAKSTDTAAQPEEVASIQWLPFDEALAALTYADDKRVLTAAQEFLNHRGLGRYLEPVAGSPIPFRSLLSGILGEDPGPVSAEQFCDDGEGVLNRYNVYRLAAGDRAYVLKASDSGEIELYERYLSASGLPVPRRYGSGTWDGRVWLLLEHDPGPDMREFTDEMIGPCADALASVMNRFWGAPETERFDRYMERVRRRAKSLANEPLLAAAYALFLDRQRTCPRTLCNGDLLPFNCVFSQGRAILVDWAFGGVMPYALDIARFIAHGGDSGSHPPFPFSMTEAQKREFVEKIYIKLSQKPAWEQYLLDIRLAVLNEYIEFIEDALLHRSQPRDRVFNWYYSRASALAETLLPVLS